MNPKLTPPISVFEHLTDNIQEVCGRLPAIFYEEFFYDK